MSPKAIARVRPTHGAVANATPPTNSIITPYRVTWPSAAETGISSPGSFAKAVPIIQIVAASRSIARMTAVMWPASFSMRDGATATCGVDARRSRLPLAASPAIVPDRAMTGHSPSMTGRKLPTRQDRKPPIVLEVDRLAEKATYRGRQRGQTRR